MAMMGQQELSAVFVTGDSISMCCEATVSGRPVYIMDLPGLKNDYYTLIHKDLYQQGYALPFEEIEQNGLKQFWCLEKPLDEAGKVAEFVIRYAEKTINDRLSKVVGQQWTQSIADDQDRPGASII